MWMDYVRFVLETFEHRPTRSWLTILGIFIGIAAVVALISLGQGMQDAINHAFEMINPNTIYVYPGAGQMAILSGFAGSERLTEHDINVIERVTGVEKAAGFSALLGAIGFGDETEYAFVIGYDPVQMTLNEIATLTAEKGRELKSGDKYKAVIGYRYGQADDIFKKRVKVGDTITIAGVDFSVVGIASRVGSSEDDKQVYIPMEAANEIFNDPGYALAYVLSKEGFDPAKVAEDVTYAMRKDRGQKKGEEDFTTQTNAQMMQSFGTILDVVQLIVIGIASISLIVGGIGIMNTMYTAVLERTHEIGVMKAIGARNTDILMIFLIESGMLGLAGGGLGVLAGMGVGKLVEGLAMQFAIPFGVSFPLWLTGGALLFSFLVGSLSGALPAMRAAEMKPADALRSA